MSKKPILHRVLAVVGGLSFLGTTAFATASIFRDAMTQPSSSQTQVTSIEDRLAAQQRGYETVLQREPENKVALEGLVLVKLQRGDTEGAIAPLEKLVELYPHRIDYQTRLAEMKQNLDNK